MLRDLRKPKMDTIRRPSQIIKAKYSNNGEGKKGAHQDEELDCVNPSAEVPIDTYDAYLKVFMYWTG